MSSDTTMPEIETEQIRRAVESGRTPVVFVHGLWLLPSSWDRWAAFFEADEFVALTPGWPDDPITVEEANAHPETFAGKSIGDVADHFESILNPWTEAKVDTETSARGPLPLISGEKDNTVPWAITNASYKRQSGNEAVTEIVELPGRGHALTIDQGWREVAETARVFVRRFV